jgi:hypothetical protein
MHTEIKKRNVFARFIILFVLASSINVFPGTPPAQDSLDFHNTFYFTIPNSIGYKHTFFHRIELGTDVSCQVKIFFSDSAFSFTQTNILSLYAAYPINYKMLIITPTIKIESTSQPTADSSDLFEPFYFEIPIFFEVWKDQRWYLRPYLSFFSIGFPRGLKADIIDTKARVEIGLKF